MKATILIIDDDEPMCWLLSKILQKHDVHYFMDGLSAMAWLAEGNIPDLIIADYRLPVFNGKIILTQLKKSGYYKDVPIIIISAWTRDEEIKECIASGALEYIHKPFDPLILKNFVENTLNSSLIKY